MGGQAPPDPLPPRLVLQVLQAGTWDRHRLHGYTFVDVPRQPGEYNIRVPLWAPMGTITQQLNSKLCGAFMPLASPHLVASGDIHRVHTLPRNRSALRAQTAAGVLQLQLRVLRRKHDGKSTATPDTGVSGARLVLQELAAAQPSERLEGLRRLRKDRERRQAEAAAGVYQR